MSLPLFQGTRDDVFDKVTFWSSMIFLRLFEVVGITNAAKCRPSLKSTAGCGLLRSDHGKWVRCERAGRGPFVTLIPCYNSFP